MRPAQFVLTLLVFGVSALSFGMATGDGKLVPVLHLSPAAFAASQLQAGGTLDQTECLKSADAAQGGCMGRIGKRPQTIAVEHIRLACRRGFEDVHAALLKSLPQLDPRLVHLLETGDAKEIAAERANGAKLWLFLTRDHGSLLAAEGRRAKAYQYEIGNPLTAERMTRHQLPAALYAPLRILLYEDSGGHAFFEYDRPSSLFGQFGDEQVTEVGRELDDELERVLVAVAG
jgi:uncharacterized protein (DUF302 family)